LITIEDLVADKIRSRKCPPDDEELRRLPDRKAVIHGRLSGFHQVRDNRESVGEIAAQVGKAIDDGYQTKLDPITIEHWLEEIRAGVSEPGIMEDGQVVVNCLGLGISARLPEDKRPDLKLDMDLLKRGELGAIYVTEGANRLSRDPDRVVSAKLLKLMKEKNCKLRTPYEVLSPRIERDWEVIHDELERGAEEHKTMNKRLSRRRAMKAARGEYVGSPVPPGFTVEIKEIKPSGRRVYGKLQPYSPHAEVATKLLKEYVKQRGSKFKAHHALGKPVYPLFPPELQYMESLTSLRKATRTEHGYLVSPAMIRSQATNPKLIGVYSWGDMPPIINNHEAAVPKDLFLEAYELAIKKKKPRGRGIHHEPLEWAGLLLYCNDELPQSISDHPSKGVYRCQGDYIQGRGPVQFEIAAYYLDKPLTATVLDKLDFTPFAEEALLQLETEVSNSHLEVAQQKRDITTLEHKLENLKGYLGCGNKEREEFYWEQCEKTKHRLDELRSHPVPVKIIPLTSYHLVKDFLNTLPKKWQSYSRSLRNQLLRLIIERVEIRVEGQIVEATVVWKTGQSETIQICRARAKGNRESHWSSEEIGVLRILWPSATRDAVLAALPGRTWKAICHKAHGQALQRVSGPPNRALRRRWVPHEEHEAKQLYENGSPISDISSKLHRSHSAILQRACEKQWQRSKTGQRATEINTCNVKQNPEVVNGITSESVFGGQVNT